MGIYHNIERDMQRLTRENEALRKKLNVSESVEGPTKGQLALRDSAMRGFKLTLEEANMFAGITPAQIVEVDPKQPKAKLVASFMRNMGMTKEQAEIAAGVKSCR